MIIENVLKAVKENKFPILLTKGMQNLDMIADMLSPMLQKVFILHGDLSKNRSIASLKISRLP
jgi:hypothetical protein